MMTFPQLDRRETGATLVVGLIMLVLITLLVLASFNLGKSNLVIVGNEQHRNEASAVAQQTIEAAISSARLTMTPQTIFLNPCAGPNTQCYDVDGNGTTDITVAITPTPSCVKAQTIKNSSLNLALEDDRRCTVQIQQGQFGIEDAPNDDSLCSNSVWDVRAETSDSTTNAKTVVNQGIAVRVRTVDVDTSCPLPP